MNMCNKCESVKYCNAACKKKHRSKHKKKCDRRVAELHDEKLFKESPTPEECPICLIPMPSMDQTTVKSCCGKTICNGCIYAMKMSEGKDLCPFCRTPPASSDEEEMNRIENQMNKGNGKAFNMRAGDYAHGICGMPQDYQKAIELFLKAGELGCIEGYYNLGQAFRMGLGVEVDMKKSKHYFELAAIGGYADARHYLGDMEGRAGNYIRSFKHFILAAKAGDEKSLDAVKIFFTDGVITKDGYEKTLRAYQKIQDGRKSDERDKARASTGIFMR